MNTFASNLGNSALVMVLGLLIVFTGLILLIGCILLLSWILRKVNASKENKALAAQASAAQASASEAQPVAAPVVEAGVSPEIVAVITAAIASMDGSSKKLVVRSIRRQSAGSAWADAARREQLIF